MIPFKTIRLTIVSQLSTHLNLPVIEMNGGGELPTSDFLTYDIADMEESMSSITVQKNGQIIQQMDAPFSASFLSYASDKATSIENAMRARDWFRSVGYQSLKDINVVVAGMGTIENRDVLIGDEWERRQGFDIDFRTKSIVAMPLEYIDTTNIQRSE